MATEYTSEQIASFAERDLVFGYYCNPTGSFYDINDYAFNSFWVGAYGSGQPDGSRGSLEMRLNHFLQRYPHEHRMVGVIEDINTDGSYQIRVLGTDVLSFGSAKWAGLNVNCSIEYELNDEGKIKVPVSIVDWRPPANQNFVGADPFDSQNPVPDIESSDYEQSWRNYGFTRPICPAISLTSLQNGNLISSTVQLTEDYSTTLVTGYVGESLRGKYVFMALDNHSTCPRDPYNACAGNLWELGQDMAGLLTACFTGTEHPGLGVHIPALQLVPNTQIDNKFAFYFRPYNLILTESLASAQNYLRTGVVPSDAIIYPWDPDEFPIYIGDDSVPSGDTPGNEPGEDGTPIKSIDNQEDVVPDYTPQRLTNNNLYWLTGGQLQAFVDWFWNDAGEVATLDDLWEKIQGLYNNLGSAIINIRFMPVDKSWIGGTTNANTIAVGQIPYTPATAIEKINRNNPTKQTIGEISIKEVIEEIQTNEGFANFSPYSQLTLYLPFHGFVDLDNDFLMNDKLRVKALYDIVSGTIQYDIYCVHNGSQSLCMTIPCKMAVDIPITLQAKGDRDSAVFQNVSSLAGNMIAGVAGAATGNPIGLTMGLQSAMSGISTAGAQSAPMNLKGSPQETGAFYSPNKCCIYIKRANFIRPKMYRSRFGYPCNQAYKLNDDKVGGFTACYNPVINFAGNTFRHPTSGDTSVIHPLESEIQEIYDYLEKGVIL